MIAAATGEYALSFLLLTAPRKRKPANQKPCRMGPTCKAALSPPKVGETACAGRRASAQDKAATTEGKITCNNDNGW
jgi:hypothetical protein